MSCAAGAEAHNVRRLRRNNGMTADSGFRRSRVPAPCDTPVTRGPGAIGPLERAPFDAPLDGGHIQGDQIDAATALLVGSTDRAPCRSAKSRSRDERPSVRDGLLRDRGGDPARDALTSIVTRAKPGRAAYSSASSCREKPNSAPPSGRGDAQIRPPIAAIRRAHTNSPMPAPLAVVAVPGER